MALKILPVFGREKEKETVKWFIKHTEVVQEMSKPLEEAVYATFKKRDFKVVVEKAKELNDLEKKADVARKKTAKLLYEGAFLPVMRSRLYDLSGRIDNVADTVKNVANMLYYLKDKKVQKHIIEILIKLGDNASKVAELVKPALEALFDNKPEFQNITDKIKDLEERSDIYQREMFDRILFDNSMKPITIQIIGWIGHELSEVCDEAKHVSDTMVLLRLMKVA